MRAVLGGRPIAGPGWKAWRAVVGSFYIAAAAFNLGYTVPQSGDAELFEGYADGAWFPLLADFVNDVFIPNATALMVVIVAFELAVGLLVLGRGRQVDFGVAASVGWVVAILPFLAWPYLLVNVVLAAAQGSVAVRRYEQPAWAPVLRAVHR